MHVGAVVCMALLALVVPLGPIYLAGVALVAALLVYEQSLVSRDDLSQVKRAFDLTATSASCISCDDARPAGRALA